MAQTFQSEVLTNARPGRPERSKAQSLISEAITITRRGGPERMKLGAVTVPAPGPREVRVRMLAAGVAYADLMVREGLYPSDEPWPRTPGYDLVGEIDEVGPEVPAHLTVGTRVAALTVMGSYARHRILPAGWCVPVPKEVDPASAVALVLNYLTAHQMMHRVASLENGDTLLIHAAAGGVGTAVLELARLRGVRVIGLCSRPKHALVEQLGGIPIDYRSEDVAARVLEITDGQGVDAVFDAIGGAEIRRSYRLLRPTGRVVSFGWLSIADEGRRSIGALLRTGLLTPRFSTIGMYRRSTGVTGYHVDQWRTHREAAYRVDLGHLLSELAAGRLRPQISARLGLAEAAQAQTLLGRGESTGKLVLLNT
ncbi:MAG: Zn-dependent oxidoreductase, NADPH:quinone reductase [Myxococcaceae bacterium]|nr:Zn-dependent oxidoreductase, NADPH:quinone reductase [Myxococcaceae bacterium]